MHPIFKYAHVPAHGITIGYQIDDANHTVTYAISRTSPRDTFNKAIGRKVVVGRITKGGNKQNGKVRSHTFDLAEINGSTKYADISRYIITKALEEIPTK